MEISRRVLLSGGAAAATTAAMATTSPRPRGAANASRALHARLMCLDTHLDTPASFARPGWDMMQRHSFDTDLTQVDYPRMVEGGLTGGFFAIYTPQGPLTPEGYLAARDAALVRAVQIREMVARNSAHFELAFTAADAARIARTGKRIVYQSIENSWPLGNDLTLMQSFYKLGVRLIGPVHFTNNQLGDSATDAKGKMWNGLSPLGKDFVGEANRLGMVLDASHASDDVFDQMMALSKSPIILSHSGCRAVHDHPRNIDDERLRKLAAAGGTIQINSFISYLVTTPPNPDREKAQTAVFTRLRSISSMTPEAARKAVAGAAHDMMALRKRYPEPRASFADVMAHLRHALDLVGPEHVGIGADWDGGGGVIGMEDCASVPRITEELVKAGYSESALRSIWGGNALRVLARTETLAAPPAQSGGG